jgi:hypothetical protein
MGAYRFIGDNTYFNPFCTSSLVYDKKDSSTNRIFCMEETCIDHAYTPTGIPTVCGANMLPSGYTGQRFEWGVEGGPWTLEVDYASNYPPSPNEFIGLAQLEPEPPVSGGSNFGRCYTQPNGTVTIGYNMTAFSNTWKVVDTTPIGYHAMGGGALNGRSIDPAKHLGTNDYKPVTQYYGYSQTCGVGKSVLVEPEIGYYDVGTRDVPPPHEVTFSDVFIQNIGSFVANSGGIPIANDSNTAYHREFIQLYIRNALLNCRGIKQGYVPGIHPPIPSGINPISTNFAIRDPVRDSESLTTFNKGYSQFFRTGYRMQKYVQEGHTASFTQQGASITSKFRDIETRTRTLGYRPIVRVKSITPQNLIIHGSFFAPYPYLYHACDVVAVVVVEVSYRSLDADLDPNSLAAYEYGSTIDPGVLLAKGARCDRSYPKGTWSPPWTQYRNEAIYCSNTNNDFFGHHNMVSSTNTLLAWQNAGVGTHGAGAPPSSAANVLSPKNRSKVAYYTYPLSKTNFTTAFNANYYYKSRTTPSYLCYFGQSFPNPTVHPASFRARANMSTGSPNNFKIWRRKQ